MPNPVIHFEIQVKDAGAAQEFYQQALRLENRRRQSR